MAVKTIDLKGHNKVRKEGIATVAIKPGYLINRSTAIGLRPHPSAGLNALPFFALENEVIGGDINGTYAIDDTVLAGVFASGSEVLAVLAASAAAIVVGDALESDGDGTLRVATTDAATDDTQRDAVVGYALEAVDNSGGGTEVFIKIEVA